MSMGTISAKKIQGALAKAKEVGVVEELCTIGEFTIVLRNLRPDQYSAVYEENKEKESIDGLYSFQKSHVCRSIVEINGIDLRDADYIEVEEEVKDPKTGEPVLEASGEPKIKKVKLERHAYIRRYLLDEWTKEPLQVAWRKFNDVLKLSEDKAKEGVKFHLPEMTPEEKLREAIGNVRETLDEVPEKIVDDILEEAGLMRISTADEIKRALAVADKLAPEVGQAGAPVEGQPVAQQPPPAQQVSQQAPPQNPPQVPLHGAPPGGPRVRQPTPEEIMARRTPMNQAGPAAPPGRPPAPQGPPQPLVDVPTAVAFQTATASQRIAAIEDGSLPTSEDALPPPGDPNMTRRHVGPAPGQPARVVPGTPGVPQVVPGPPGAHAPNAPHLQTAPPGVVPNSSAAVLSQKGRERVDMQAFGKIIDQPPPAGINPRFRAPR